MPTDLLLICHGATEATRSARFPADEPLKDSGADYGLADRWRSRRSDQVLCAPSMAARQTASALGLRAEVEPAIRDCDLGRWVGRTFTDVGRRDPEAFSTWGRDPDSAPHGGESLSSLLGRIGAWVDRCGRRPGRTIAVTHGSVIRAAMVHAIDAPARVFWHLDAGPLSQCWLRNDGSRWVLRSLTTPPMASRFEEHGR